jgi:RNA polymerase sigma-70 factor (ECF subfamily)
MDAELTARCPAGAREGDRPPANGELMGSPEERRLAGCRAGDLEAFRALYVDYAELVYHHAYHLVGDREEAHDIRQETFLRALRALPKFRGDCSLRTFLLRICTNLCRDYHRSRRVRGEVSLEQTPCEGAGFVVLAKSDPGFGQIETADLVRAALARLSPARRAVVVLRDLENLSNREIAAVLGCSPASVPVKLFRARRQLEAELKRLLE